jgi:hypothetical protein
MKPNIHRILARCIEEGLIAGFNQAYNRAYKHDTTPSSETITDSQYTAIMNELDEYFIFDGVGE